MSLTDGNGLIGPDGMNIDPRSVPQGQFYSHMPMAGNMSGNMMRGPPPGGLQPGFAGSKPTAKSKQAMPVHQNPRMQQAMRRQDASEPQFSRHMPGGQVQQQQPPQQMWAHGDVDPQRPPMGALPMNSEVYRAKATGRAQIILDINTELLRQALTNPKQSQMYVECMKRLQTNIAHLYTLNDSRTPQNMPVPPPILTAPQGVPSLQNLYAHLEATFGQRNMSLGPDLGP